MQVQQITRRAFVGVDLPKEHGATVAFGIAAVLANIIAPPNPCVLITTASMICIMLSLKRLVQLILITAFSATAVAILSDSMLSAFPILAMGAGALAVNNCKHLDFGLKQSVGMAAVAVLPLLSANIQAGFSAAVLSRSILFVACTLISTAIVQVVTKSSAMSPRYSLFGAAFFLAVAFALGSLHVHMALVVIPFIVQLLWLRASKTPSFKMLGMAQTLGLLWCAAVLII